MRRSIRRPHLKMRPVATQRLRLFILAVAAASALQSSETVLIVGASRGIGLGLAQVYAESGAVVHATARDPRAASLVALGSQFPGRVVVHALEVRNSSQRVLLGRALDGAALDLVIYNAGIGKGDRETQTQVNADAPFAVITHILPALLESGVTTSGAAARASARRRLCVITSDLGTPQRVADMAKYGEETSSYAASKLLANTRFRAAEPGWRSLGILAIAMQPGKVATGMGGGRGRISPRRSAGGIKRVLDRLGLSQAAPQSGGFYNYRAERISWKTGRPCAASGADDDCKATAGSRAGASVSSPQVAGQQDGRAAGQQGGKAAGQQGSRADASQRARGSAHGRARRRASVPAKRARDSAALRPNAGEESAEWRPLVGTSAAELLAQDPDPLRALSEGRVPAIVLRNQLEPASLAALNARLEREWHAPESSLWSRGRGLNAGAGYIGAAFTSAIKWKLSPKQYANLAPKVHQRFEQAGLHGPVSALYGAFRKLGAGRSVRTARDVSTNRSFTPATFRMQPNGTYQQVHLDSMQSFERLACRCERALLPRPHAAVTASCGSLPRIRRAPARAHQPAHPLVVRRGNSTQKISPCEPLSNRDSRPAPQGSVRLRRGLGDASEAAPSLLRLRGHAPFQPPVLGADAAPAIGHDLPGAECVRLPHRRGRARLQARARGAGLRAGAEGRAHALLYQHDRAPRLPAGVCAQVQPSQVRHRRRRHLHHQQPQSSRGAPLAGRPPAADNNEHLCGLFG